MTDLRVFCANFSAPKCACANLHGFAFLRQNLDYILNIDFQYVLLYVILLSDAIYQKGFKCLMLHKFPSTFSRASKNEY